MASFIYAMWFQISYHPTSSQNSHPVNESTSCLQVRTCTSLWRMFSNDWNRPCTCTLYESLASSFMCARSHQHCVWVRSCLQLWIITALGCWAVTTPPTSITWASTAGFTLTMRSSELSVLNRCSSTTRPECRIYCIIGRSINRIVLCCRSVTPKSCYAVVPLHRGRAIRSFDFAR